MGSESSEVLFSILERRHTAYIASNNRHTLSKLVRRTITQPPICAPFGPCPPKYTVSPGVSDGSNGKNEVRETLTISGKITYRSLGRSRASEPSPASVPTALSSKVHCSMVTLDSCENTAAPPMFPLNVLVNSSTSDSVSISIALP
jgi:hypothetical protein